MRARGDFKISPAHHLCRGLYCHRGQSIAVGRRFIRRPPKEKELGGVLGNPAEWSGCGRLTDDDSPPARSPPPCPVSNQASLYYLLWSSRQQESAPSPS